jgi:23S rRNA (guanosine2251-2'-O)-methyltransferase
MSIQFTIYECSNHQCRLRFPLKISIHAPSYCPKCKHKLNKIKIFNNQKDLEQKWQNRIKMEIILLLDNLRSAYNVGSILRSADGFEIEQIFLCGITPSPTNPKTLKTSLGAEKSFYWEYQANSLDTAHKLKERGFKLIGLEIEPASKPIFVLTEKKLGSKVVIVLGNEIVGIDPDLRILCDDLIYIPMLGYKQSFNVTIAFGIIAFYARYIQELNKS